ncbi:protein of unknown function [Methylomagnum ishizawai]|uniref:Galactose oxidase-like Early set domain-containing protein n=1 Tax=Methylomagnum ishizawai TaxID=1760988 RepID=A0A1Y6D8R6_9GAMM|nr:galactose oxidase early set domain-containing protein [Methylomagnum ishizawai]SMF96614.1 protein of unknown function [Methylomagnum ishizawai]
MQIKKQSRTVLAAALASVGVLGGGAEVRAASSAVLPFNGGPDAYRKGAFGPLMDWPLIPIHVVLQPDGRVLSFGTDLNGTHQPELAYDVWEPALGTGSTAHLTLDSKTPAATNVFCAGQALVPITGQTLVAAGTVNMSAVTKGIPSADTNLFDYRSNQMVKEPPMALKRWYPSLVSLAGGGLIVMGGKMDTADTTIYGEIPEVYEAGKGWRVLSTAASVEAYGARNWYYPRAWQAPNGKVFIQTNFGAAYDLDPTGTGTVTKLPKSGLADLASTLPSAMFAPGKILFLQEKQASAMLDINGAVPVASASGKLSQMRYHGNATLLADGQVVVTGGSSVPNSLSGAAYAVETWNPATGLWTLGAVAAKARLYHSTALLLPDATVLVGGGGAPGPLTNLNAEIYYPPYLFATDGSGELARRPLVLGGPSTMVWNHGYPLRMANFKAARGVKRVTLVRAGADTHNWNNEQRFFDLAFHWNGTDEKLRVFTPANAHIAPPGYYLLFVFNPFGVPSVGRVVKIGP